MKPLKILLSFLGLFTLTFSLHQIHLFSSDEPNIKQLFSDIYQSLNLSFLFTFIWSFEKIKKIQSVEEFKAQRKNLIIYIFLFTWILNFILMLSEAWVLKHDMDWKNGILFSLSWAVISMLLSLLFSGAFMKRKLTNSI